MKKTRFGEYERFFARTLTNHTASTLTDEECAIIIEDLFQSGLLTPTEYQNTPSMSAKEKRTLIYNALSVLIEERDD